MVKEYGRQEVSSIQVLFFLFLFVLLFFLLVFSFFRTLSIISSVRYFLIEAYPFKNICQMETFRDCLFTKRVFTEQVVRICL